MRRLLFALALLCTSAQAAPPAYWPWPLSANSTPPCVRQSADGWVVAWAWADDFTRSGYYAWGLWSQAVPDWGRVLAEGIAASDAQRRQAWDQHMTAAGRPDVLAPLFDAVAACVKPPPLPDWRVPVNTRAVDGSRPTYTATPAEVGGVTRGAQAAERAPADAACDCSTRSVEGSSTYCSVLGRADRLALCRRVN
jgi:hypothetical protein